jgi:hypothetical protein
MCVIDSLVKCWNNIAVANIRLKIRNEFLMKEMDPVTAKAQLKRHLKATKELIAEHEFEQLAFRKNLIRDSGELTKLGWKLAEVTESDDSVLDF